jgi:luciferase family oxidoreductase group 1
MRALRQGSGCIESHEFGDQVADLLGFLTNQIPSGHRYSGARAEPDGPTMPEPWLLGSSAHGSVLAARLGCAFSFAHFISPDNGPAVVRQYSCSFRPSNWLAGPRASVCAFALCADTEQEAHRLALSRDLWGLRIRRGVTGPFPSVEEAEALIRTSEDRLLVAAAQRSRIVGDPEQVRARLIKLAEDYDVNEIMILSVCFDPDARRRSYELIAEAFDLPRQPAMHRSPTKPLVPPQNARSGRQRTRSGIEFGRHNQTFVSGL